MLIKPLVLTAALAFGFAPALTPPPIKMGLWEQTSVTDIPNVPAMFSHRTMKVRSCITPDSWAKSFASNNNQKNCERKNEMLSGGHYTADIVCQKSTGHFDITFSGEDAAHGTMDLSVGDGKMTMHSVTDMHFVSSDCGSVTPDKPEIVK